MKWYVGSVGHHAPSPRVYFSDYPEAVQIAVECLFSFTPVSWLDNASVCLTLCDMRW
jgi:ABC-type polysaccharide/polyol phosphate export permease